MTPAKLITIATITTGAVGGSAGIAYALTPNKPATTIEEKLTSEGFKLLKNSTQEFWTIKLSTYNKEIKKSNTEVVLGGEQWDNLKSWCEAKSTNIFEKTSTNLYEGIKKICTVPSNKEKINSTDKKLASTPTDWQNRKTAYDKANTNELIAGIEKNVAENKEKIKEWCEKSLMQEYEGESKNNYSLIAKWCVNE